MVTIYGKNVIKEALMANRKIYEAFILDSLLAKEKGIVDRIKGKNIKITVLNKIAMNNKFQGNHQGFAANVEDYQYKDLADCIDQAKKQCFIILNGLEDPQNLGAILRTADATQMDGIIIPKNHSVSLNGTVAKVSVGAIEHVNMIQVNNLARTIDELKEKGFWIIGTDMHGEKSYMDIDTSVSLAIIIGSEGFGMSRLVREKCDYLVNVPMHGYVNSLNASVTAALLMYEVLRKKQEEILKYYYNDYELLYLIKDNNERALDIMMEKYKPLIWRVILNLRIDPFFHDDYFQEGLICLYRSIYLFNDRYNKTFTRFFELVWQRRAFTLKNSDKLMYEHVDSYDSFAVNCFVLEEMVQEYKISLRYDKFNDIDKEIYSMYFDDNFSIDYIDKKLHIGKKKIYNSIEKIKKTFKQPL